MVRAGMIANNFIVRPMSKEDVPIVAEMERQHFSTPYTIDDFCGCLSDENKIFYVVDENHKAKGYVGFTVAFDTADITTICVRNECRGRGYGSALMLMVLQELKKRNVRHVFLEVRVSNEPAKRLYAKMGFQYLNIRKNYYRNPTEDAWVMLKEIEQ